LQRPDFSEYRRETVVLYLQASGLLEHRSMEELVLFVVMCLLKNDEGPVSEDVLFAAMSDPSTLQVARTLIEKAKNE
jgi:hypothetical protein